MKESKTIKEYTNKLLSISNKIKLVGNKFLNSRLLENYGDEAKEISNIYCFVRKYKIFIYNYFERSDSCLASIRATNINERKSWD